MDRRRLLTAGLSAGLILPTLKSQAHEVGIVPIHLSPANIFRTTVCLRPFRAAGPRIEAESIGRKTVVHHYGHGGSGWSLSWGSAFEAVKLAMESSPKRIAVIGAGAIGLTTALTAQQAGAEVTIYAKDRYPFVPSANATGTWSPDSRVAKTDAVAPEFADQWERMARRSWTLHNSYVALPGDPVEWLDQYSIRKLRPLPDPNMPPPPPPEARPDPGMLHLGHRIGDIIPSGTLVPTDQHPFNSDRVNRWRQLTFNVTAYAHRLEQDFLNAGGRFVPATFHAPSEVTKLKESVIINCTGYGARALWRDESIQPFRGQIVWLAPQENTHYGFYYNRVSVLARRDGIVVQATGPDDNFGMNDISEIPDMDAAYAAIDALKDVYRQA